VNLSVQPGDPATPADEADLRMVVLTTDVRRQSDLSDYPGQLQARMLLRITDKDNPPPSGSGSSGGTVQDTMFSFTVPCTPNTDPETGSSCATTTSADAVAPGAAKEGMRAVWQVGQLTLLDGGPDDLASTNDNTVFAREGIFVP
jgi:hypothetical protein